MLASSRFPPSSRIARPRLADRLARGLGTLHRLIEDAVLPSLGSHPALGFRDPDR
jgi:hypothetical protein